MTRIDRMEQLLDSLRQQLLERADARRADGTGPTASERQSRRVESSGELRQRIGRELRSHDLSTEIGRRRARRSFFEAVLAWDMGDSILRDPKFGSLIENLDDTLGSDERSSQRLNELLAMLAANAPA